MKCKICEPTDWGKLQYKPAGCMNCETHCTACCHVNIAKQVFGEAFVAGLNDSTVFELVRKLYPRRKRFGKNEERDEAQRVKISAWHDANGPRSRGNTPTSR